MSDPETVCVLTQAGLTNVIAVLCVLLTLGAAVFFVLTFIHYWRNR